MTTDNMTIQDVTAATDMVLHYLSQKIVNKGHCSDIA